MRAPSQTIKHHLRKAVGESSLLGGLHKNLEKMQAVKEGMDTPFGAALYTALEDLERASYAEMGKTNPINIFKHYQIRAELRTCQYIKQVLDSYVVNHEVLLRNIEELKGDEDGETY